MNKSFMKQTTFIASLLFLSCFMGTSLLSSAQSKGVNGPETPVQVGSVVLNLGLGVGANYNNIDYHSAFGTKIAVEIGLWQAGPGVITLGGEFGGTFTNGGYNDDYKAHTIIVAGRAAWHAGWGIKGLDTYGGFSAGPGFQHVTYNNDPGPSYSNNSVVAALGVFVGASYFVTPNFGFNAEAGYDITNLQIGIVFKLM